MNIVFGLWADGGASPDHGGGAGGSMGQPVVGPAGLVDLLEVSLGIGGPRKPQVVRIASFQSTLEGLEGEFFWSGSLGMDPWSTARTLLAWRDELIGLGWQQDLPWHEPRLADLAVACRAASQLPPGLSDRIAAVLKEFEETNAPPIERIRLIDSIDLHPSPIRRLVVRLRDLGSALETIEVRPAAPPETSLGKLQRWMLGAPEALEGSDGTVTVASSVSEPLAAEIVGQWFAGQTAGEIALVAQDGDTDLLDHGLSGFGQPRAGRSRSSIHRGSLQLLLLAFKSAWAPFDPHALMELLVFPNSPVAPRAAWHLASALEKAPGRGGPEWEQAWARITEKERERAGNDADELAAIGPRLARWREWAEQETANPVVGMPLEQSLQICDRVTTWAARRYAVTSDLLYAATSTLAGEVRTAIAAIGRDRLPRLLVERVIDQALDLGQSNPSSRAEAASWRSVPHPGSVWAPTTSVVWWNFGTTREGTARSPWSDGERRELAAADCPADEVTVCARAASAAWERVILNARGKVLLVAGGLDCEADDSLHPLAHRLKPALDVVGTRIGLEAALSTPALTIAGTTIERQAIAPRSLPTARFSWETPAGFSPRLAQITESATSLENLLSCQLMWALRHVARLRPGRVRSIPDANQLLGNLAHAIAREVFTPGTPPEPDMAAQSATDLLEGRIDQLAAPLRHPEFAEELNFARRRLPAAMASLARCLSDNQLMVESTEQQVSGTFEPLLALRGAIDLVARDRSGNAVIIDLKWTRSEKARMEELSKGRAVQLATYGALFSGEQPYRAGYFLLNQRQFATLEGSGLVGRLIDGDRSFPDTWAAIVAAWSIWRTSAEAGQILATGVEGVRDHLPPELTIDRDVHCERCDYSTLCRVRGLA
ncbi:PD-(D/E)XK nuclease family protein [Bosea sp. (in: a-proteobacteria)]|uniref:PD-(D/E)XK nuclease family protein n=1 Tax=Bosea sp. (in: a-proteobacteria) TaxID=1871050 RepID=UPI002732876F|nr:PD-(D/E)XK nuclease family protein [Bosea sp. (in: a-proteobacteria)]MDP3411055.1 PD-(D/E)XK nuclease family protein [Bosea sp. (in: a-proteobacteria)]